MERKKGVFEMKGVYNNYINALLMTHLHKKNINVHFIKRENDRECLVRSLNMIKLEFIVRNIAAGSICSRLGLPKGKSSECSHFRTLSQKRFLK